MKVLLITLFFPPERSAGTENYTLGLAQALLAKGHGVQVLCAESWESGAAYWNGVTKDRYDSVPVNRIHLNWSKAGDPNRILYESLPIERWLDRFLEMVKPDVVHVTSTITLGVGLLRSVQRAKIPLVLTLMDFWFICPRTVLLHSDGQLCDGVTTPWECQQCLLSSSGIYRRTHAVVPIKMRPALWGKICQTPSLNRLRGFRGMALNMASRKYLMPKMLELPNVIISHSRFVQQMFARTGLSQRVLYLPNGHDTSWLSKYRGKNDSNVLRFGYLGQITEIKGIHVLIEGFRRANMHGDCRLDIWGDMATDSGYTQRLQGLVGSTKSIYLRGRFKRDQLATVLAEIDVLVVPSLWYENAPLVIQEAFAASTPVIATNLGGMAEVVSHNVNGLLFERGNADDLAKQLRRLVDEPGLFERLQDGVPSVKTIEAEVIELEAIYWDLIIR